MFKKLSKPLYPTTYTKPLYLKPREVTAQDPTASLWQTWFKLSDLLISQRRTHSTAYWLPAAGACAQLGHHFGDASNRGGGKSIFSKDSSLI